MAEETKPPAPELVTLKIDGRSVSVPKGTNLLGRILKAYPQDEDALQMVYLHTLARKPTDHERQKCRTYIQKTGNRAQAFEDILWALLNSTEFQTKR